MFSCTTSRTLCNIPPTYSTGQGSIGALSKFKKLDRRKERHKSLLMSSWIWTIQIYLFVERQHLRVRGWCARSGEGLVTSSIPVAIKSFLSGTQLLSCMQRFWTHQTPTPQTSYDTRWDPQFQVDLEAPFYCNSTYNTYRGTFQIK